MRASFSNDSHTAEEMRQRDLLQQTKRDEDNHRHNAEYNRSVRWSVDQGPQYWPAHEFKHLAPGDDSNFIFKIPPWNADGSPNPLGIPDNRFIEPVPRGFELPIDWNSDIGWNCHKCNEWVPSLQKAFEGGPEPDDWWWCYNCRKNKPKMSAKEKKVQEIAKTVKDIRGLMVDKSGFD